jgi:hypothetical protein
MPSRPILIGVGHQFGPGASIVEAVWAFIDLMLHAEIFFWRIG